MTKEQLQHKVNLLEEELARVKSELALMKQRGDVYLSMVKATLSSVDR